jgi:hypothetical protein
LAALQRLWNFLTLALTQWTQQLPKCLGHLEVPLPAPHTFMLPSVDILQKRKPQSVGPNSLKQGCPKYPKTHDFYPWWPTGVQVVQWLAKFGYGICICNPIQSASLNVRRTRFQIYRLVLMLYQHQLSQLWTLSIVLSFIYNTTVWKLGCLSLQMKPTQLGRIDGVIILPPILCVLVKDRTMDNVQNCDSYMFSEFTLLSALGYWVVVCKDSLLFIKYIWSRYSE